MTVNIELSLTSLKRAVSVNLVHNASIHIYTRMHTLLQVSYFVNAYHHRCHSPVEVHSPPRSWSLQHWWSCSPLLAPLHLEGALWYLVKNTKRWEKCWYTNFLKNEKCKYQTAASWQANNFQKQQFVGFKLCFNTHWVTGSDHSLFDRCNLGLQAQIVIQVKWYMQSSFPT